MILEIPGHVPSKKNMWAPRKGGGIFLNTKASQEIEALVMYARMLWGDRQPKNHPILVVEFHVLDAHVEGSGVVSRAALAYPVRLGVG